MSILCKLGIHDYVSQDAQKTVDTLLTIYMEDRGFKYNEIGSGVSLMASWDREDGVQFCDTSHWACNNEFDDLKPNHPVDKACLRCGKLTHNYRAADIANSIDSAIKKQLTEMERKRKAKTLIASKGERS